MNNYTGAIKQLYAYGLENELAGVDAEISDKFNSVFKTIVETTNCAQSDVRLGIEEILANAQNECAEIYYEAGFRKAMNIMFDALIGGGSQ